MKIIPIKAENGVLKISVDMKVPSDAQLSILLKEKDDIDTFFFEGNKSFSFLKEEPELYNDNDILKNRKNEKFLQ